MKQNWERTEPNCESARPAQPLPGLASVLLAQQPLRALLPDGPVDVGEDGSVAWREAGEDEAMRTWCRAMTGGNADRWLPGATSASGWMQPSWKHPESPVWCQAAWRAAVSDDALVVWLAPLLVAGLHTLPNGQRAAWLPRLGLRRWAPMLSELQTRWMLLPVTLDPPVALAQSWLHTAAASPSGDVRPRLVGALWTAFASVWAAELATIGHGFTPLSPTQAVWSVRDARMLGAWWVAAWTEQGGASWERLVASTQQPAWRRFLSLGR